MLIIWHHRRVCRVFGMFLALLSIFLKFRKLISMPQELSLPHLLLCLAEKDKYKGTQAYLSQIQRQNEEIYPLINAALLTTLLQLKTSPMSRLLSLRFFKEILITANFSLIDAIDQKIEEHIISVAQYNKKSKEVNRGANFFNDVYNTKNDGEVQKISSSYVLLALEIVAAIGKWYLVDEDGEETRFVQYLVELGEAGVTFPSQLNFFKKEEEEKFKRNYQKWAKGYKMSNESMKKDGQKAEIQPEAPQKVTNPVSTRQEAQQVANQPKEAIQIQEKPSFNETPELLSLRQRLNDKEEAVTILQSKLKQEQEKNTLLQSSLKTQETVITKLQDELKATMIQKEKPHLAIQQECYKIFISPPKNSDDLIEEIDSLKEILEKTTENYQQEKQLFQQEIKQLKTERDGLKTALLSKQEKVVELQQKLAVKQQQVNTKKQPQNAIQAFLLIIDQPKVGSKQMYEHQMLTIKQKVLISDRKEEILKDFTNSNKLLRQNLAQVSDKKIQDVSSNHSRQGSRSLKKTESQHRQKISHAASTSNFMKMSHTQSKLIKTTQGYRPKQDSKLTTIFPFLDKYFPEIPSECKLFKKHCLSLTEQGQPFFQNEWIKTVLIKRDCQQCFLQVTNKTASEQKIKVMPTHACLSIQGEKIKKVPSSTVAEFEIKLGLPDLNMRCPTVSIIIGNHGISLTQSINEKIFHVPLPITLLDFFSFKKPTNKKVANTKTVKYGANRFILASGLPNLQRCFPGLASQYRQGEIVRLGEVQWCGSSLHLQLSEWSRQLTISVEMTDQCGLSSSIGKVLLQILMYLLKE